MKLTPFILLQFRTSINDQNNEFHFFKFPLASLSYTSAHFFKHRIRPFYLLHLAGIFSVPCESLWDKPSNFTAVNKAKRQKFGPHRECPKIVFHYRWLNDTTINTFIFLTILYQEAMDEQDDFVIQCSTSNTVTIEKPIHRPRIPPQLATNQMIGILWSFSILVTTGCLM